MPNPVPTLNQAARDVRAAKEQVAAVQKQITEDMIAASNRYRATLKEAMRIHADGVREFNHSIMGAKTRLAEARRVVWKAYNQVRSVKSYLFEMGISPRYPGSAQGDPEETDQERQVREEAEKFLKSRGVK